MHVNVRKEKRTMAEDTPDLVINSVTVPPLVGCGTFNIDVNVTASDEDFEDGVAFRLFVVVTSLLNPGVNSLIPLTGHLQTPDWPTPTFDFQVPVTVNPSPLSFDIYNVTAVLVEGPSGVPDVNDLPSLGFAGPILVFC